ncbi:unnamed protein product [Trichobilharzia szidati]|nr:unnamed protein product [Trichobilharzia szidati]
MYGTFLQNDISSSFGYNRCTTSMDDCCRHLLKVADVLAYLPYKIYYRALGYLCNCVCAELVKCIVNSTDITQSDCDKILILLDQISGTVRAFFVSSDEKVHLTVEASMNKSSQQNSNTARLHRRCPEYQRLQGVISVLSVSSLAIIRDALWMDGKGPLSTESRITAFELSCLIKALHSSSSMRDEMLKKLHIDTIWTGSFNNKQS